MTINNEWDLADLQNKAAKEDMRGLIKISGCGISAIGERGSQSLIWVIQEITKRGGIVEVTEL